MQGRDSEEPGKERVEALVELGPPLDEAAHARSRRRRRNKLSPHAALLYAVRPVRFESPPKGAAKGAARGAAKGKELPAYVGSDIHFSAGLEVAPLGLLNSPLTVQDRLKINTAPATRSTSKHGENICSVEVPLV